MNNSSSQLLISSTPTQGRAFQYFLRDDEEPSFNIEKGDLRKFAKTGFLKEVCRIAKREYLNFLIKSETFQLDASDGPMGLNMISLYAKITDQVMDTAIRLVFDNTNPIVGLGLASRNKAFTNLVDRLAYCQKWLQNKDHDITLQEMIGEVTKDVERDYVLFDGDTCPRYSWSKIEYLASRRDILDKARFGHHLSVDEELEHEMEEIKGDDDTPKSQSLRNSIVCPPRPNAALVVSDTVEELNRLEFKTSTDRDRVAQDKVAQQWTTKTMTEGQARDLMDAFGCLVAAVVIVEQKASESV